MKRFWVIVLGIILSFAATFIPLSAAIYLSWLRAQHHEETYLSEITERLFERVRRTYVSAEKILFFLNDLNNISPCSKEHINIMRNITLKNRVIDEVNYLPKNRFCRKFFFRRRMEESCASLCREPIKLIKDGLIFCLKMLLFPEHMVKFNSCQRRIC